MKMIIFDLQEQFCYILNKQKNIFIAECLKCHTFSSVEGS